jgi:MFS family permease
MQGSFHSKEDQRHLLRPYCVVHNIMSSTVGYLTFLRTNRNFRRLWYGQIVSQLGDWFASVALFALTLRLTGSGQAVGLLFVAEFLPGALVGPFAGVLIDRLPRKLVMIASDIGRALLVLGLLFVREPADIWIVYVAVVGKVAMSAFFEPARSAILPSVVSRDDLVIANTISGATWSAVLALGAALGGLVAGLLGAEAAFIIDAASFLLSAVLIATVRTNEPTTDHRPQQKNTDVVSGRSSLVAFTRELGDGLRYIANRRDVALYTFTKALWSLGGGILLLLTLFGKQVVPLGQDGAISIGLLYAARGVGTAIGPIIAQRVFGSSVQVMQRWLGPAFLLTTAGYLLLSISPSLPLAMIAIAIGHTGGSIQWVYSTALLQLNVEDRLRGRVFAIEYASLMLATALSSYLTGIASDNGLAPRTLSVVLALIFVLPGIFLAVQLWGGRVKAGESVSR